MALTARLTKQLPPFMTTEEQNARVRSDADKRRLSLAEVMREALDKFYGLERGEAPKTE